MKETALINFNNSWYSPKASKLKQISWYIVNCLFFKNSLNPINFIKVFLLRSFGATIGIGVVIKPNVNIKYPWLLEIGEYSWIGESVWIDNLIHIKIGKNVCVSQGALLLTGNHDYKKSTFDLQVGKIILEDGVWIGARAVVCPGLICHTHSILTAGSIATKDLEPYKIYQGNPATIVRERTIV
ncbi:MAG: WcaF family extracellular polysaccharide biosynthesis acetyltransferase [Bacteroidota bacterium]